jgi:hypothetical protein
VSPAKARVRSVLCSKAFRTFSRIDESLVLGTEVLLGSYEQKEMKRAIEIVGGVPSQL